MEKCKICGREFKDVISHAKNMHDLSKEEYEELEDPFDGNMSTTNPKEIKDKVFGIEEQDVERPLSSFLKEFDITERQLRQIVRQYKTGRTVSATESIDIKQKNAKSIADGLIEKDVVEVNDLFVAECLERQYGFKTVKVISAASSPKKTKTWVLEKVK